MKRYKIVSLLLTATMALGMFATPVSYVKQVSAAKKVGLSKNKLTIAVGKTATIKLKNNKKSVKWTVVSGKSNISISKKTKTSLKVKAKKAGSARVQAKVGTKKYTCTIKVVQPASKDREKLKSFIAALNKKGSNLPTDIDNSYAYMKDGQGNVIEKIKCYEWGPAGQLLAISWRDMDVTGKVDTSAFTELRFLGVEDTEVEEINVSNNRELTGLSCDKTRVKKIDVSKNKKLERLHCAFTEINEIDIRDKTKLKCLYCVETKISEIDVSKNINLEELYCDNTLIDKLDVSKNTKLKFLCCTGTKIKNLDVSKNINLEELYCDDTLIEKLDVSKNEKLKTLNCSWTKIKKLDVSNNDKLTELYCEQADWEVEIIGR